MHLTSAGSVPIEGFILLAGLLLAATVVGWGPGVHISLAQQLLADIDGRLGAEAEDLLRAHTDSFQYGCIAADIINLKKYGGLDGHCHNWNIKERLDAHVESDADRAFVWGYLCHLAADVVAHHHFVPFQLVHDLPPYLLGHVYWEARADGRVDEPTWQVIDGLRTHSDLHRHDRLVKHAVPRRALSMPSNKFIFNHVLLARSKKSWRDRIEEMAQRKPVGTLQADFVDRCLARCLQNMFAVFEPKGLAELRALDPNGHQTIDHARQLRRQLTRLHGGRRAAKIPGQEAARTFYEL